MISAMQRPSDFWDALAPHHASLENNYLDVRSARHILRDIVQPVLVVGAGLGLIVEELRRNGLQCDGVDLSSEMIRYAMTLRAIELIHADARALPFATGSYETVLFATGVIDFIGDEELIQVILKEGRRVATTSGRIFVAFYRMSPSLEELLARIGLLKNHVLFFRELLEMYRMGPAQTLAWVAKRAQVSRLRAAAMLLRAGASSTMQETKAGLNMRKVFRDAACANALLKAAPETQPYRNEHEIRNLFMRLGIPIKEVRTLRSCHIVRL
jgi:ubiquinone/menaquinone biosynthesis C-methylase UbiE